MLIKGIAKNDTKISMLNLNGVFNQTLRVDSGETIGPFELVKELKHDTDVSREMFGQKTVILNTGIMQVILREKDFEILEHN